MVYAKKYAMTHQGRCIDAVIWEKIENANFLRIYQLTCYLLNLFTCIILQQFSEFIC